MVAMSEALQTRVGNRLSDLFLADTCTVETRTDSVDPQVDPTFTSATLPCKVQLVEARPQVGVTGGRVTPEADVEILFNRGANVTRGARITVRGQTYVAMDDAERNSIRFLEIVPAKDTQPG